MAYTNVYSEAAPLGSTAANLIDDLMRSGKLDIRERLESIFGTGIFTTDPVTVTQIKLTGASAKIIPGTVGLLIKDNADANINVNIADNGDFAVNRGRLFINAAVSKIVPGATSFSVRNTADGADNIIVTDAGVVTLRNTVTITSGGLLVSSGGLTVSAGAVSLVGDVTLGGRLLFSTSVGKIVPGATSFSIRNNADSRDNLLIDDLGNVTAFLQFTAKSNIVADRTGLGVDSNFVARGDAGHFKGFASQTGSLSRWYIAANSTAESGANAGSDLIINRYDDTGVSLAAAVTIIRSTGATTIAANLTIGTGLVVSAGGITITAGALTFGTAASQIVPGATSFSIRNNANAKDNIFVTNSGQVIITGDAGTPPLVLDQLNVAAALATYVVIRRNGTIKARFGLDASDSFVITDSTGAASNLIAADNGNVSIRGALTVGNGTLALNIASGTILTLNSSTNLTTDVNQLIFQRGGSNKWRIGSNISGSNADEFNIFNDNGGIVVLKIANTTGAVQIPVSLQLGGGGVIGRLVKASLTWNPGTVATGPGGTVSTTVTLTGAVVGDAVIFSNPWESDQAGCVLNAWVTSANTVTVTITQYSGSPTTFTSRTISVWIIG